MAENTDALEKALTRGRLKVQRSVGEYGESILKDFKASVSVPYPPPSAPGMPPHVRTGRYREALAVKTKGLTVTLYVKTSFANALAIWLEWGTHRNGRPYMLPRPHWRVVPRAAAITHRPIIHRALTSGERSWRT